MSTNHIKLYVWLSNYYQNQTLIRISGIRINNIVENLYTNHIYKLNTWIKYHNLSWKNEFNYYIGGIKFKVFYIDNQL